MRDPLNRVLSEADQRAQTAALMDHLVESGMDLEALLAADKARQAAKLEARRELLRNRKRNRRNQELEAQRVEERTR
jgi:hypothetical protein